MPASYLLVIAVGIAAGAISGVIGTGTSAMLLPVLVYAFGPKQAVPIMAVASLVGNVGRAAAWWRQIDWRVVAAYALPGAPAAALGARTLWALPPAAVDIALGCFFILMVPTRHWLQRRQWRMQLWHMAAAGAAVGFLTGLVLSTGPLSVPAFAAYGLVRGTFLGTEAASALALYAAKVATFTGVGALTGELALKGLLAGLSLTAGAFVGKAFVLRMPVAVFQRVLDGIMLVAGVLLIAAAW